MSAFKMHHHKLLYAIACIYRPRPIVQIETSFRPTITLWQSALVYESVRNEGTEFKIGPAEDIIFVDHLQTQCHFDRVLGLYRM